MSVDARCAWTILRPRRPCWSHSCATTAPTFATSRPNWAGCWRDIPAWQWSASCTNDADAYPQDRPERLADQALRASWTFPYLVDHDQAVGRAYSAACTPDFFLFDAQRNLAYRGAFDESTPGNGKPVTGALLAAAIAHVAAGEPVPEPHRPSLGCSIKWRS